nr:virion structural protein [Microvirus sp.]
MQFKTQYDARDRIFSEPGSPEHITYAGHYDEKGRVVLEESGRENIYDFIQSHAESCDIHVLMKRYQNGDVDALSQKQGFYGDFLDFPKTYAEALNHMNEMERQFMALPVETREKFGNSFTEFLAASGEPDFLDRLGIKFEQPKEVSPAIPPKEEVKELKEVVKE